MGCVPCPSGLVNVNILAAVVLQGNDTFSLELEGTSQLNGLVTSRHVV